jgi:hypothetical protein
MSMGIHTPHFEQAYTIRPRAAGLRSQPTVRLRGVTRPPCALAGAVTRTPIHQVIGACIFFDIKEVSSSVPRTPPARAKHCAADANRLGHTGPPRAAPRGPFPCHLDGYNLYRKVGSKMRDVSGLKKSQGAEIAGMQERLLDALLLCEMTRMEHMSASTHLRVFSRRMDFWELFITILINREEKRIGLNELPSLCKFTSLHNQSLTKFLRDRIATRDLVVETGDRSDKKHLKVPAVAEIAFREMMAAQLVILVDALRDVGISPDELRELHQLRSERQALSAPQTTSRSATS